MIPCTNEAGGTPGSPEEQSGATRSRGRTGPRWALAVVALLSAFLAAPAPALAYDYDAHYAWTYYLALHVGFTARQAFQIASGAQAIDTSPSTDPYYLATPEAMPGDLGDLGPLVWQSMDPRLPYLERWEALRAIFDLQPPNLTAILGPQSPYGNPAMGRVWTDFHCFTPRALQDRNQRAARGEPVQWTFEDLVGIATQTDGLVADARERRGKALWDQALDDGNPGPYLHFRQDCHDHSDFTDLRGHAWLGHAPDWWATHPMHAWAMTEETIEILRDYRRQYLREPTSPPDTPRIRAVFQRLIDAYPAEFLGVYQTGEGYIDHAHDTELGNYQNFWGPVLGMVINPDLDISQIDKQPAYDIICEAIAEDWGSGRLPDDFAPDDRRQPFPEDPIPYVYDMDGRVRVDPDDYLGGTTARAARARSSAQMGYADVFQVERPEVEVLGDSSRHPQVVIQPDRRSQGLYAVDVTLTYEVDQVADFGQGLPLLEQCAWSDGREVWGAWLRHRKSGTWQITSRVYRTYEALNQTLSWTCTLHADGLDPVETTIDVRWTGPPPEDEEREPGADEELVALWEALMATRDQAIGLKATVEDVCTSAEAIRTEGREAVKEVDRASSAAGREVKALERTAGLIPTALDVVDGHALRAYASAEQAAESRGKTGESALETCQTVERIQHTEDIEELLRLREEAEDAHTAAKGWRDDALDRISAAQGEAERARTLADEVSGFESGLRQVQDTLGQIRPSIARTRAQVESAFPALEGARPLVARLAPLQDEATRTMQQAEELLEARDTKENKRVVRRMRGLAREIAALYRNGAVCLDEQKVGLDTLSTKVAAVDQTLAELAPRVESLGSISLDPTTLQRVAMWADDAAASADAADLFTESVRDLVDQSATCLGVGRDVVKERTSPEAQVAKADCTGYYNVEPRWNRRSRQAECYCIAGHGWNSTGSGCDPVAPPSSEPTDPNGAQCAAQALLITGFRINPDPSYQRMAQQTAEQALAMGCSPALIAQANGGSAGGSTSSGAAGGTGYRSCEWTGGARTWGQDEQIDEYYCHCFLVNSDGSFGQSVEPQGDWECGPYPH